MTQEQVRALFNEAITAANDPEVVAHLEIAREYLTNEDFRSRLSNYVFRQTYFPSRGS